MAEAHEVSRNEIQDLVIAQFVLKLEDVLHQIITECILNKYVNATNDDLSESQFLTDKAFFEAALHHTTTVLVRSNLVAVSHTGVKDELSVDSKRL